MIRRLFAAALAVMPAAAPALAATCNTPAEVGAMQFRQLQIELMVAALKCQGGAYDFRGQYGAYMHKAGPALTENAKALKAMFARQGKGAAHLDRYMTAMSNDTQIRSLSIPDYCDSRAGMMDHAVGLPSPQLHGYAAETVGLPYDAEPCPATADKPAKKKKKEG